MSNLQRSQSAPETVVGLAKPKLARSKSYLHVEKHEERRYMKPLVTSVPEREDPFNLAGFFPPEGGSWRWLRTEPIEEEEAEESAEEAIRKEDKLGILSLFSGERKGRGEELLLSPYQIEATADWDAVYEDLTGRRRRVAEDRVDDAGWGLFLDM